MPVISSVFSKKNIFYVSLCLTLFPLLFHLDVGSAISAEDVNVEQADVKPPPQVLLPVGPEDDYDRGVPRSSVKRFLSATSDGDFETAAQYLDLSNLPREMKNADGPELAKKLKFILDQGLWIDVRLLSDHPEGYKNDGLPPDRDLLGKIETDKKTYTLFLQTVTRARRMKSFFWILAFRVDDCCIACDTPDVGLS